MFGKIANGEMVLSECGKISVHYWQEIPNHFAKTELDKFVVMPNHIHGILIINNDNVETPNWGVSTNAANIGIIINQYKQICAIHLRQINPGFAWQSRFHDHIIRDKNELHNIRQYIINNPMKWELDDYYRGRL